MAAILGLDEEGVNRACIEALGEGSAECLHRLLEQPLVVGLARLEPRALVVRRQLGQKLDALPAEASKVMLHRHATIPSTGAAEPDTSPPRWARMKSSISSKYASGRSSQAKWPAPSDICTC